MQRAVDNGTMLSEQLAPVSKELRVVVLGGKVRFETRPDVNVHAFRILAPGSRCLGLRRASSLTAGAWRQAHCGGKQKDSVHCADALRRAAQPEPAARCHRDPVPGQSSPLLLFPIVGIASLEVRSMDTRFRGEMSILSGSGTIYSDFSRRRIVLGDFLTSTAIALMLCPSDRNRSILITSFGSVSSVLGRPPTLP